MAISTNLTISGVNETTFAADKSILENIIADVTNTSSSSVEATFMGMLSSIATRNGLFYNDFVNTKLVRSNENRALINVVLTPRDKPHETYSLSKMNTPIKFRDEVNLALKNQPTESNPTVLSVSQISRIPG